MANVLTIVPARAGSKGVPRKNLRPLGGIPLIAHVLRAAKACTTQMRLIVSTDSEEIKQAAENEGVDVPFLRPDSLAGDKIAAIAPIQHALDWMDQTGWRAEIVMAVHPTSPFLTPEILDQALDWMTADEEVDSVVAVRRIEHNHPFRSYAMDEASRLSPLTEYTSEVFLQKQDRPDAYGFVGGLYVRRRELIENWDGTGFALGKRTQGVLVSSERAVDIDSELDMQIAQVVFDHLNDKGTRHENR